ncbi:PLP-dependent aminotransferase family protein [Pseudoalteromonas sp. MMG013]|uniref:aminotransferase-like domain-containing protein n=1 Tax=Pseudoalteromonas sp. MMG013 TaxID=2822687 RepID=UPI001B392779|nr:PLP-dependent aminotransferase family protein [Pseudoalteromonas sp. MMG013]MBQ4860722.1 PLP-dependent aminotransferase family protein [Pseudoalteromonas sp. MMG013]
MSKTAKYKQLGQQLINNIENNAYSIDEPLPSLRTFCALHQISMTTALACYRYVESLGYITAFPKKGYFVTGLPTAQQHYQFPQFKAEPASFVRPKSQLKNLSQTLATAELDSTLIDSKRLSLSLTQACKHHDQLWGYASPEGEYVLRHALSNHFTHQGFALSASDLLITHGCLDAVQHAISVTTNHNDVILVSSPCYSGLLDLLCSLNRQVIEIPSNDNGLDLEQMENALRQYRVSACLLSANHQNPTGHSLTNTQKQKIAELAHTYQTPIIEDDVFRELSHTKVTPLPIKHYDRTGWVIWCGSFSKSLSAGLRLGWCAPGRFFDAFLKQLSIRTLGVNKPLQLAMANYINKGHYQQHLKHINQHLCAHKNLYLHYLQEQLPNNSSIYMPSGGMVLWLAIPALNTEQLAMKLAHQHIYIKPGTLFCNTSRYDHCFRLNIGLVPTDEVKAQLTIIIDEIKIQLS